MKLHINCPRHSPAPRISAQTIRNANADELRVLLYLLSVSQTPHDSPREDGENASGPLVDISEKKLAKSLLIPEATVTEAIKKWRFADILQEDDEHISPAVKHTESARQSVEKPSERRQITIECAALVTPKLSAPPTYNGADVSHALAARPWIAALIDDLQRDMEKLFSPSEASRVVALCDYYGFDADFILMLTAYGKTHSDNFKVANLCQVAEDMFVREIITADALEKHIADTEAKQSFRGRVLSMFGVVGKPSKTQTDCIDRWSREVSIEMVELAHDITQDKTGKPDFKYTDKILLNWAASGVSTPEEYQKHSENYKAARNAASSLNDNVPESDEDMTRAFENRLKNYGKKKTAAESKN